MRASTLLIVLVGAGFIPAVAVVAWDGIFPVWVAYNLCLAGAVFLDYAVTPKRDSVDATRKIRDVLSIDSPEKVVVTVSGKSPARLRFRVRDECPGIFLREDEFVDGVVEGAAGSPAHVAYSVTPTKRGLYAFENINVRWRSLLGLLYLQKAVPAYHEVKVYPSLENVRRFELLARADRLNEIGMKPIRLRGASMEFESLRPYVVGDDIRKVDWKATAKRNKYIVREYEDERNRDVILAVDAGRLMLSESGRISKFDYAVNSALLLSNTVLARGDKVGLQLYAEDVKDYIPPGKGQKHYRVVLDSLYAAVARPVESAPMKALSEIAARHKRRSLVVVITDFVSSDAAEELIDLLLSLARRHVILFAALRNDELHAILDEEVSDTYIPYKMAAAAAVIDDRRAAIEKLTRYGVHAFDVAPCDLDAQLINQYLKIKRLSLL